MAETHVSLDDLRALIDETRIECLECGWKGHSIQGHLREAHNQDIKTYKEKHPKGRAASKLVAEVIRSLPRSAQRTADLGAQAAAFIFDPDPESTLRPQLKALAEELNPAGVSKGLAPLVPPVDDHFVISQEDLKLLAFAVQGGKHIYDSGPTGCGKTSKYLQLFGCMEWPVRRVNMNGDVTYANFVGQKVAEEGSTRFELGFLPQAMEGDGKRGYALIVDEIDYMPPQIAAVLNPVLDMGTLFIPEVGREIKALPGFQVIATANTGGRGDRHGNYTGTEVLNAAFLNRFHLKLISQYLQESAEINMLRARFPQQDPAEIEVFVHGAALIREAFERGEINVTFSTRSIMNYLEAEPVLGQKEALKVSLLNWTDEDDGQTVREMLQRVGVPNMV